MLCMWMFKKISKYKNFPKFFFSIFIFALSFLPSFNNICLLIFYFCDRYSGNAREILKNQTLKNHNFPLLLSPSAYCSKGLPGIRKEAKKAAKKSIVNKLIKSKWDYGSHTPLPPFGGSLYCLLIFMLCFIFC